MKHAIKALLLFLTAIQLPALAYPVARHVFSEKTFEERIRDAELAGDREQVATICREWYASGQYSPGVLNWNYNALMSVEENSILLTHNESDTYPAFLLQYALNVRPDITILNVQLLENQKYRTLIAQSKPFIIFPENCSPEEFINRLTSASIFGTPAYFGIMSNKDLLRAEEGKMYLTGLALKYSETPFDNIAVLRYNYENLFRTDYLNLNMTPESEPETVARINLNYVPALTLLHRHYTASGESAKADRVKELALNIARAGDHEAEVSALFKSQEPEKPVQSDISPKVLDKAMKKIGDKLYAAETEVTNAQYELFLQDLLKNRDFDQLALCRTTKTDWRALLPENLRSLSDEVVFKNGNPDDGEAPVENISHESAQHYCDWITKVYNASTAKKKFKKVLFRLPTQEEWILAASGGLKDEPYPWPGGYYVRNSRGCYLCNMNATEPCGDCASDKEGGANDGGFFPVHATSYFPNAFGLYCVSGNVAEMVQEPGITKGGSWKDAAYFCQIRTINKYTEPAPSIGFRVFMEVIEE